VRILLDQNLSPKLIRKLADVLLDWKPYMITTLIDSSDPFIFDRARRSEVLAVLSADRDFIRLAERFGPPPKMIRIDRCDFAARVIGQLLRREAVSDSRFP
jgi:predicted nuclease of predicted toxin-antitoxin system